MRTGYKEGQKMSLKSKVSILTCLLLTVSIIYSAQVPTAHSWGWRTHQFITQKTINVMPSSLSWFFTGYSSTIVSYCTKPDDWKNSSDPNYDPYEQYRHYYHVNIPHDESDYNDGVLPWAVEDNFNMFVQNLKENNLTHAAQLAGVIGHYIEDASMPLHATSNYNPGYNHGDYESEVNYQISIDNVNADVPGFVPYKLDNIFNSTMQLLTESYQFAENKPDNLSYWLKNNILWNENIKRITENRLRTATQYLANVWYTGMVQAGLVIATKSVEVFVSPSYQSGIPGATLIYTLTVKNNENVSDNYFLENTDNIGWSLSLDNNLLAIPAGENRTVTLRVTIPENAVSCTEDNISVTVTSLTDNTVENSASCIAHAVALAWTGSATFSLENLYKLNLYKDNLWLYQGSKLVVKFYTYNNAFENQTVIHENFALPWRVVPENENVAHPSGIGVKRARLDLTGDNTENVISTIASFTVHQSDLRSRDKAILAYWGGHPELWPAFREEDKDILTMWASAPP